MTGIRISAELTLPLEMVGESTALLAMKGAGKSNTAKVIVEGAVDAGIQVVVLDPVGHWWGLRSLFSLPVIGGMVGDVPLEPNAGRLLAEVAVESGQSMVLDVSGLDTNGAMQKFTYELGEHLYKLKQASPSPMLLILEEADEFAPQHAVGANVARMVGAFARIVKRGRGRGLGVLAITQRSAALSKNVLDQSSTLIVMRTVGPRDRKAIEEWVKHQDAAGVEDVIPSLPKLKTGEAWFWTPERDLLARVTVDKARSLDTSQSPIKVEGGIAVKPKELRPIDLAALGSRIAETAERAKDNDPAELKKRIRDLERERSSAPTAATVERVEVEKLVEVPALTDEERSLLAASVDALAASNVLSARLLDEIQMVETRIKGLMVRPRAQQVERRERSRPEDSDTPAGRASSRRPAPPAADTDLSSSKQRILDALSSLEKIHLPAPAKLQLALFAKASPKSSGYTNNLGALRAAGLIDYPAPGRVQLTDVGREAANGGGHLTQQELHAFVFGLVGQSKARILERLIEIYPNAIDKTELAERAGTSATSSGYTNNLGSLRSLGLIDYPSPGVVVALEVLFP